MAKIHGLMDLGKRGMQASQTALQTASHNITNKSTEGYTRQRVEMAASQPMDEGRYRMGTGAQVSGINRINNPWIEKQLEREGSQFAFLEGQTQALGRIENALNEQSVKGLNSSISEFFGAFRELANNPESALPRTQVREAATALIQTFKDAKRQFNDVSTDLNKTIETGVSDANLIAKEIADLNQKIHDSEIAGNGPANDERDRRDLLVKKLSEKMDITYAEDPKSGMLNITAGNTAVIVAGTSFGKVSTYANEAGNTVIYNELSEGGAHFDITDQFRKGAVGGSLAMRDGQLSKITEQLDDLAYNIAANVNQVHAEGYDRYNQTGVQFFDLPQDGSFQIENFKISQAVQQDVGKIAAASKPGAPGDNTVANVIQELQYRPLMEDGKYSFDDFYNSKVGEVGVLSQRATSALESQKNTLEQLKNVRESVSGVSLDEEAAKMIEYQKTYEASARMIKIADEMFDTILNLKRL
ncbi:MAG: flagellar hook-associated protein FlgK [Bdellovibrionaceae bacterium]|nr:flagellar hook-associated protein FlgK [Pseudobdellovibrionaceae bacterium]